MLHAAGAVIIPVAIGDNDLAQAVHTVAVFAGTVAQGTAAAAQLAAKLRDRPLLAQAFAAATFGRVHAEVIGAPFLVRCLVRQQLGDGWAGQAASGRDACPALPCRPTPPATPWRGSTARSLWAWSH